MPLASRVGIDAAGGTLLPGGPTFVLVAGAPWAVLGCSVAGHGLPPHQSPTVVAGSTFVRIGGVPVVFAGCAASCGHATSGSGPVSVAS